jgi:hypothetical protein
MVGGMLVQDRAAYSWGEFLTDLALRHLWEEVGGILSTFAYPTITSTSKGPLAADSLAPSLGVRNLLGAMYLQFYWLMTSGSGITRCQHCNSPFSLGASLSPQKRGRKTNANKRFCSKQCRQNHYYQTKVKPEREKKKYFSH